MSSYPLQVYFIGFLLISFIFVLDLHSYFVEKEHEKHWSTFCLAVLPILQATKINIYDLTTWLLKNSNQAILFVVDEISKISRIHDLIVRIFVDLLVSNRGKFMIFFTALNKDYVKTPDLINHETTSGRAILPVILKPRPLKQIEQLFESKLLEFQQHQDLLRVMISFCNNHMRTCEALYKALSDPHVGAVQILNETLSNLKRLQTDIPQVNEEDMKIAILSEYVDRNDKMKSEPIRTYQEGIELGYFYNADDLNKKFIPRLTPFALFWVLNYFLICVSY